MLLEIVLERSRQLGLPLDDKQVLSVGVPVCRLTEVFRQSAKSRIITNAHRINHGHERQVEPGTLIYSCRMNEIRVTSLPAIPCFSSILRSVAANR